MSRRGRSESGTFRVAGKEPRAAGRALPGIPESLAELETLFDSEHACCDYLQRLRWPVRFSCPRCGSRAAPHQADHELLTCRDCRRLASPTTATLLHLSPRPLRQWFRVIWEICSSRNGTDPARLQQILGLSSRRQLWDMYLDTLQVAMRRGAPAELWGLVEVARCEVTIGGERVPVLIAGEVHGDAVGCLRLRRLRRGLPADEAAQIMQLVTEVVEPGSTVRTSDRPEYDSLHSYGFDHVAGLGDTGYVGAERARLSERVVSLLRLWLFWLNEPQAEQADYYLDELVFRYNERLLSNHSSGTLFVRLLSLLIRDPARCEQWRAAG